ncbi:MAG: hypothetical protein ACFWT4_24785 [Citrobacter braakii]
MQGQNQLPLTVLMQRTEEFIFPGLYTKRHRRIVVKVGLIPIQPQS